MITYVIFTQKFVIQKKYISNITIDLFYNLNFTREEKFYVCSVTRDMMKKVKKQVPLASKFKFISK